MNTVAIVGRPNVGKSTLFNRLIGFHKAIVDDFAGVTRDRNIANATWQDQTFLVVDTGGFTSHATDEITAHIQEQIQVALYESALVLLVTDCKQGVHPLDQELAQQLFKMGKPVILVVNKADNHKLQLNAEEFYSLGFDHMVAISAAHNIGISELLEMITKMLPSTEKKRRKKADTGVSIAVLGKPNVGKSSLVNALLGQDRAIVSKIPGTTRDSIDSTFMYHGNQVTIIDTAGIRRKSKVSMDLEKLSILYAIKNLRRCDVAVQMIDATEGITEQDAKIAGLILKEGRGVMIAVNKWDLIEKDNKTVDRMTDFIHEKLKFLRYAPILYVSALTRQRLHRIIETALLINQQQNKRIPTPELNRFLQDAMQEFTPPRAASRATKILYAVQSGVKPPAFHLFTNNPKDIHFSYKRFLVNRLRAQYGFIGAPILLVFRKKPGKKAKRR